MPRPTKGHRIPGSGIKKGTKHQRTLAEEACHKLGIDPFNLLAQMAINGSETAVIHLCKSIEPPKKPVEVQIDPERNSIRILVEDYTKK